MNKTNNPTELRQRLETTLDFISRSALGHDTGHCVHFANKAEAELCCVIDELDAALAAIQAQGVEKLIKLKMEQLANMHPDTHAFGATAMSLRAQINELQAFAARLREGK